MRISAHLIAAMAAIGFAGMVAPALAQQADTRLADTHERSEMRALHKAKLSLFDAASAVEQQSGGMIVYAVFHEVGGVPSYQVVSMKEGSISSAKVDAMTGEVTPIQTRQASELTASEHEITTAQKPRMSMREATMAAEQQGQGKCIEAQLTTQGGNVVYTVAIVPHDEDAIKQFTVEPTSGAVSQVK